MDTSVITRFLQDKKIEKEQYLERGRATRTKLTEDLRICDEDLARVEIEIQDFQTQIDALNDPGVKELLDTTLISRRGAPTPIDKLEEAKP